MLLRMEWKTKMMKPSYKVPSMSEIAQIKPNGFSVVSTFSGCGGSCLGYRMAGFKVLYANEFIPAAQKTYKANHPESFLDTRDIRIVQPDDILSIIGKRKGEIDLFDGSPPCASFSLSGQREKKWGTKKNYSGVQQKTDDLFFEYTRLLNGLQPKVFVAENVKGLVLGSAIGYFKLIFLALKDCGYNVEVRLLDAKYLGVPQSRQRLIFMGIRNDLNFNPIYPKPLPYFYSVGDAIGDLQDTHIDDESCPLSKNMRYYYNKTKPGDNFSKIMMKERGKRSFFNHTRLSFCKCSPTITTNPSNYYHPSIPRHLSINEVKRLSGFPDDFILTGSYAQKFERIGRAVPPVMMYNIAKTIQEGILEKIKRDTL